MNRRAFLATASLAPIVPKDLVAPALVTIQFMTPVKQWPPFLCGQDMNNVRVQVPRDFWEKYKEKWDPVDQGTFHWAEVKEKT